MNTSPTCNHSTIQRGREHDYPFYNNRHRLYRTWVHGWLLPPISMTGMRLTGERVMRSDGRQPEVVLEGDLGWIVGQQRTDGYGNVGQRQQWNDFGAQK